MKHAHNDVMYIESINYNLIWSIHNIIKLLSFSKVTHTDPSGDADASTKPSYWMLNIPLGLKTARIWIVVLY